MSGLAATNLKSTGTILPLPSLRTTDLPEKESIIQILIRQKKVNAVEKYIDKLLKTF